MLALGVGNAWADDVTFSWEGFATADGGKTDYVVEQAPVTLTFAVGTASNAPRTNKEGSVRMYANTTLTISCASGNITKVTFTPTSASYNATKLQYNGTALTSDEWTLSSPSNEVTLTASAAARFKTIVVTYTAGGGDEPPTPTTQYTVKWYTAIGTSTDVTLNEGAAITKPATDPTMSGYEFMGWTDQCSVAEDGTGFTALTDFGTADADKEFYAVFAVATTTGGGGETGSVTMKYSGSTTANMSTGNNAATVGLDANEWSVLPTKGSASNMPGLNKDGDIRLYGHASGGNYLTISSTSYTITDITVTYTSNSYNNAAILVNSSKVTGLNGSYAINANSFVIKNANTNTTQVRIKTLVINYSTGGGSTKTYSNYTTTCSGATVVETLTDAQFAWSAATAEATKGATNTFPTLTNTVPVSVTYESSNTAAATIEADGTITLVAPGTTTISAKFAGGEVSGTTYAAKTVKYDLTVLKAPATPTENVYVKVTETAGITDGEYLIVYEDGKVAFNGALTTLDAVSNTVEVVINSNTIAGNTDIDAATFTINVADGTILSASGYYIGQTSDANGLKANSSTKYENALSIENDGTATVKSGGAYLRYNSATNNWRFRYYKSSSYTDQKAIALYKKASSHTLTYGTCTNGSVSADVADGATVLSGTTITLTATPATDYKLSAYDVYKTDDATVKVTVTDGKFVMPEFDVTISAAFEAAKTLTSIEITTPATQTTFWQGETLNYTGLVVTAHFDGAADEVVTPTVTGSTATAGTQTVTVSFTEGTTTKTTTYEITVKATANTEETAYNVATALEIIDKVSTANDIYVAGIVSEIVTAYNATYGNITYNISADGLTTSAQLQAFRGKSFNGDNFTSANDVKVGDEVVVFGNLLKYNSTYELAENNKLISLNRNKAVAGLAFETTEYTANVNEAFTAPTLTNPNGLTVTYSTSDATLATVDATTGAVTILDKTGKVTITATFAGNESYLYGTASYNITISDPNLTEATFNATVDKGNATQGEGSIAKSPITFACTDGILGNGSEYRLYKDATISFTAENGFAITKVVLTSTASGTSKYGPGHLTAEEGTYSYSDETGTWVGEAQTVTLTATAQSRATLITVYYKTDKRQDAGIAWSTDNVSITLGDAFTAPTLSNPNGLTLTCTSDNEDLVTVTNTGVITLKSGILGKATITAKFDGNTNYKDAKVSCTITVNPKTETVVILAQYNGQWYALKNVEQTAGKVLAALPVNYVGGKLYNVEEADKATIEWQRAAVTDGIIFKNGDNYISGTAGSTDLKLSDEECAWTLDGTTYKLGNRTFFYNESANGFKNYNTSNAGNSGYSNLPTVTAPVYATGDAYGRTVTTGEYGTICIPYGSSNYTGAEFYEISWLEMDGTTPKGIWLDQVNGALTAGKPYIFKATADEIAIVGDGTTAAAPVVGVAGLTGTFTLIQDLETSDPSNTLEGNYMIAGNQFLLCGTGCWLKENRAYIDASIIAGHTTKKAEIPGRRRVCLGETSENTTTGVDNNQLPNANIQKVIENGQFIIIRDGVKYNVQGQVIR